MKKIIFSFLAIALTIGVVSGTAYALFFDTATVAGISVTAGSADIKISGDGETYVDNAPNIGVNITDIFPGYQMNDNFFIQNVSASIIGLDITGQLTSAGGDWAALSPKLWLKIDDATDPTFTTGWLTLAQWNNAAINLPSNPLAHNTSREYIANFQVDPAATSAEIAGKSLTNITFVLTGTQVAP
ncbi:hypothetical protein A2574_02190 [Candidatus Shapirobacteria bacterium RIFOXYD1_FULL_38_32]|uniref:SipW-cognate class signal peptide n=1 Tax=Candidatus Shapirobacteria bacterium RIFOXYB1_FULL_38_38 TaxID=1802151 RepID=A0A1F7SU30_9BACT|nr:MAG: hypothetical protein A2195_02540 [Candidatus Shapirobacteria bacterium RIFOXYA1_FULL_39_17]OGL57302.1 MAG: hypothetical protein A2367_02235 [Candidatus Shapirobacteria bacterium RIFOXYB1_FULL_38_38]OGL57362.1 MAG: hypothetical protein A2410_02650 [Candidatus Shapirobacteria bacterium RIFOXYC1_FULL_38_24]OGL57710.1 MAG: hypothetical protein A2574_02190 [Candidatus Shapirobacteria bacterium RIFOXYD1_FULL_38_32]